MSKAWKRWAVRAWARGVGGVGGIRRISGVGGEVGRGERMAGVVP